MKANFEKGKFHRLPKIIIPLLAVLFLAAGGFFWWQNREIKGSPKDYVIKETEQGKIVENKKAGLTFEVLEGWEGVKIKEIEEGSFIMQTLDIEGKKNNGATMPPLTNGCGIEIGVNYKKLSFEEIEQDAKEIYTRLVLIDQRFERTRIGNKEALKNIVNTQYAGPMIGVYVPVSDKVYNFTLIWSLNEEEECMKQFDDFLETVSIQ